MVQIEAGLLGFELGTAGFEDPAINIDDVEVHGRMQPLLILDMR